MNSQIDGELDFLSHPQAGSVLSDHNPETIARRAFVPRKIDIFNRNYSQLQDQLQYTFSSHSEAVKILPDIVNNPVQKLVEKSDPDPVLKAGFEKKMRIGVVFSGGPAPGGHNVIAGIWDAAKAVNPDSQIIGFLYGPDGILESRYVELTGDEVDHYRNTGGFTMIKTGRTKIDTPEKMDQALKTCLDLELTALVIIGGDDSNTNAAFLAQHFKAHGIQVIGVPKTIDGDVQVKTDDGELLCATSFGFHSAARAFSRNISNLAADASSDRKYWHVCKVMGRVASHLALESALQTHANLSFVGEELADYVDMERIKAAEENGTVDYTAYGITLRHLSRLICDVVVRRAAFGKNHGIMILPEGILEFVNEIQVFIIKLNKIIADYNHIHDTDFHTDFPGLGEKLDYLRRLGKGMMDKAAFPIWNDRDDELFNQLPSFFQEGLLVERDLHGNFQFSLVKTEDIILDMVKEYLDVLKEQGLYKVGIPRDEFMAHLEKRGLDSQAHAGAMFQDPAADYLLVKREIISLKTLKQALVTAGLMAEAQEIAPGVKGMFLKSVPNFRTQTHFYGYDGRGGEPTLFDCTYTYNLGLTAFHLMANGATGQMAVIKNLEKGFAQWEPLGIPI
ncbi:MAG: 6-phosphofructokinase, partial [Desulfobacterales bacterium]|nr:6-phosphofructokinase [Desulfobacterales bacterium]